MPTTILVLAAVAIATATDLQRHKIYNWTTYPGIAIALALNASGYGDVAFGESLIGLLACGLIMLVCFVMLKLGGGDVKLIAMIGAFLGTDQGIEAMLWTFVLGGAVGLIVLIWRVGAWRLMARTLRQVLYTLRLGKWSPLTDEERAVLQPRLFLAPCALAAVIIVRFSIVELVESTM